MKIKFINALLILIILITFKTQANAQDGIIYQIIKDAGNPKIKPGDVIKINFVQKTDKDSLLSSTYDYGIPQILLVPEKTYVEDIFNYSLTLFGEGDSVIIKLNIDTIFARNNQNRPEIFENNIYLTYTIKIEKVLSKGNGEIDSIFQKKTVAFFEKENKEAIDKLKYAESAKIKAYIEDKDLKTTISNTSLQYVIEKAGDVSRAKKGDTVLINYTINSMVKKDGGYRIFDTSDEKIAKENKVYQPRRHYGPTKLVYGNTIPGFTEAFSLIGKGGKISAIIPSELGYGEQGYPHMSISPYTPLFFNIEIVDIIKSATVLPKKPTKVKEKTNVKKLLP